MTVPPGPRLGIDVGSVRIGIAVSDPEGTVAVPLTTVPRGPGDVDAIVELARQRGAAGLVVGLPRTLSGGEGSAARSSREFALRLARRASPTPVQLVDERLTTAGASRGLREAGLSSRRARHVVDQVAAAAILQGALDSERAGRVPAGEVVDGTGSR
jgi:putative Holliday junction resolvase